MGLSVIGGDTQIGVLAAAFANGDAFTVIDPAGKETIVTLGRKAVVFPRVQGETVAIASSTNLCGMTLHCLAAKRTASSRRTGVLR